MAKVTVNRSIPDDDPRYRDGWTIIFGQHYFQNSSKTLEREPLPPKKRRNRPPDPQPVPEPEKPDTLPTETSSTPTKRSRGRDCTAEYLAKGIVGFQLLQPDEPRTSKK